MTEPVELAGFVLSLAMVYCNIREIHWGWPLAILTSALYGVVFWNSQLYGEASLQVMFILGAVWGWRQWRKGMQSTTPDLQSPSPLRISQLSPTERQQTVAATLLAWPVLAFFLKPLHRQRCGRLGCFGHGPQLVGTIFVGQKENRKLVGMAGSQHHHSRLDVGEVTLVNFAVVCVVCDPQLRRPQSMAKTA